MLCDVMTRILCDLRNQLQSLITLIRKILAEWAYDNELTIPSFGNADRNLLLTRFTFWNVIDNHLRVNGCFVPLKQLKHVGQAF